MTRLVATPAIGDIKGLAEARAARRKLLAAALAGAALASLPWRARFPPTATTISSR
jgi:hypothetical protein